MTDWIEHNGGPQPVGDDVWVEIVWPNPEERHPAFVDEIEEASEIPWEGHKFRFRILNQHLIDAARLEGIRLGLGAAERAIQGLHDYGDLSREIALEDASMAVCALDPDTIAREAVLDQLTREAQAQNMGHDPNDAKENAR